MTDEKILQRLADTRDDHQERQPAEHRHLHDRVETGQHIRFERARQTERAAQQNAEHHTAAETHRHARHARAQMHPNSPLCASDDSVSNTSAGGSSACAEIHP